MCYVYYKLLTWCAQVLINLFSHIHVYKVPLWPIAWFTFARACFLYYVDKISLNLGTNYVVCIFLRICKMTFMYSRMLIFIPHKVWIEIEKCLELMKDMHTLWAIYMQHTLIGFERSRNPFSVTVTLTTINKHFCNVQNSNCSHIMHSSYSITVIYVSIVM